MVIACSVTIGFGGMITSTVNPIIPETLTEEVMSEAPVVETVVTEPEIIEIAAPDPDPVVEEVVVVEEPDLVVEVKNPDFNLDIQWTWDGTDQFPGFEDSPKWIVSWGDPRIRGVYRISVSVYSGADLVTDPDTWCLLDTIEGYVEPISPEVQVPVPVLPFTQVNIPKDGDGLLFRIVVEGWEDVTTIPSTPADQTLSSDDYVQYQPTLDTTIREIPTYTDRPPFESDDPFWKIQFGDDPGFGNYNIILDGIEVATGTFRAGVGVTIDFPAPSGQDTVLRSYGDRLFEVIVYTIEAIANNGVEEQQVTQESYLAVAEIIDPTISINLDDTDMALGIGSERFGVVVDFDTRGMTYQVTAWLEDVSGIKVSTVETVDINSDVAPTAKIVLKTLLVDAGTDYQYVVQCPGIDNFEETITGVSLNHWSDFEGLSNAGTDWKAQVKWHPVTVDVGDLSVFVALRYWDKENQELRDVFDSGDNQVVTSENLADGLGAELADGKATLLLAKPDSKNLGTEVIANGDVWMSEYRSGYYFFTYMAPTSATNPWAERIGCPPEGL